jgi:2'-5' RNA ligase
MHSVARGACQATSPPAHSGCRRPESPALELRRAGTLTRVGFERFDTFLARDPIAHSDPYHRRVSPREFRDHWADSEPDWSHGGTWLTSFVLPPKVVGDTVSTAAGHMHLPFLAPVPAAGIHITVQRVSRLPDPIQQELPQLLDAVERELADADAFDATLAEPVVGSGSVYFDVSPQDRFAALQDGVRRGIASLIPLGEPPARYWPHLAVAYATGAGPIESVDPSPLRLVTGLTWHVDEVAVVELRRTPRRYRWDVLAEMPLRRLCY